MPQQPCCATESVESNAQNVANKINSDANKLDVAFGRPARRSAPADFNRLTQVAKVMLDDGLEPERVARILQITVEKLEELAGLVTS